MAIKLNRTVKGLQGSYDKLMEFYWDDVNNELRLKFRVYTDEDQRRLGLNNQIAKETLIVPITDEILAAVYKAAKQEIYQVGTMDVPISTKNLNIYTEGMDV